MSAGEGGAPALSAPPVFSGSVVKKAIDFSWVDNPIDVSAEVNFIRQVASLLQKDDIAGFSPNVKRIFAALRDGVGL